VIFCPHPNDGLRKKRANIAKIGSVEKTPLMFSKYLALDNLEITDKPTTATIIIECTYISLSLNLNYITLGPALKESMRKLIEDRAHFVPNLVTFFDYWGTHYVDSCGVGGAIILELMSTRAFTENDHKLNDIASKLQEFVITGHTETLIEELKRYNFRMKNFGGEVLYCSTMEELCKKVQVGWFEKWKESVKDNPVVLPTTYVFEEIYTIFYRYLDELGTVNKTEMLDDFKKVSKSRLKGGTCDIL